jgi:predicted peroxiredoxin
MGKGLNMAKLAFVATHGSENPTKAVFPFLQAKNAVEAGIEAEISLIGDAVVLIRDIVQENIDPVGWPPLKELFAAVVKHKIPIYV